MSIPTQVYNPLHFYCAPNQATPDYIIYPDFELFVAYGLLECWLSHDPADPNADCSASRPVDRDDVLELRQHFLDVLETAIVGLWRGALEPGQGDLDGDYETVIIGTEEDDDPLMLTWRARLDKEAIALELDVVPGDPVVLWLYYEPLADRADVLRVLTAAEATVGREVWDRLVEAAGAP